jgi:amino acid adenylation domain-containing protein/non-ribosomal peptide synthase protein (TIGR01720 family)
MSKIRMNRSDLSSVASSERESELLRLVDEESQRPFNLTSGPLLRISLLCLNEREHVFVVVVHHIVSDGWSLGIFFKELSVLYDAFSQGQPSLLPDLQVQYADYAVWQRQHLQGELFERQLSYWKGKLADAPDFLNLPTNRLRPPMSSFHGALEELMLPKALSDAIKALALREGATLFMVILAAWQILLMRHSGQDDIIVGFPMVGRTQKAFEPLIGLFVNTVVLRSNLSCDLDFRAFLGCVKEMCLEAYDHQEAPFERLVEELQPTRSLSHNPMFQVFINMTTSEQDHLQLRNLDATSFLWSDVVTSKFDMTLYINENEGRIGFKLAYNSDLFDRFYIEDVLQQVRHLLGQIVDNCDMPCKQYSLVTPQSAARLPDPTEPLFSQWNQTIHEKFEARARQFPYSLAVQEATTNWTYCELDGRSNQIARYLQSNGIGAESVVAIYANRSAFLVMTILGVLKAGAAFLILDPSNPELRLIDILGIARPQAWIQLTSDIELPVALNDSLNELCGTVRLSLPPGKAFHSEDPLAEYSTQALGTVVDPDSIAYIIFTSGSTGIPKAVIGSHRPVSHFIQWCINEFSFTELDRFSSLSGLSYDPFLREIFTPLSLGAALIIPNGEDAMDNDYLVDWLRDQQITVVHLTPALGRFLTSSASKSPISSVRYLFFGGDVLTAGDIHHAKSKFVNSICVNCYGTTETPQVASFYVISDNMDLEYEVYSRDQVIPLGKGIADVQAIVVNSANMLAGIGELGTINIRTPYLSNGYLNDVCLSNAHFAANPFTKTPEDRVYKTGDLARWLPDGNIEFLGRLDDQVKVRGYRIELGEVESALLSHPAVQDTVVIAREDMYRRTRLIAFIVADGAVAPSTTDLRRRLKDRLPEYMMPSAFVFLDRIPLTPNGKVDRKRLPDIASEYSSRVEYVAPRTPEEELLCGIWADVLRLDRIGVHDNFFDIGGDSLHLIVVLNRLTKYNLKVLVRDMYQYPTISELCRYIHKEENISECRQDNIDICYPVTPRQFSVLREEKEPNKFLMVQNVHITGLLDTALLIEALSLLIERHDALRTRFVCDDNNQWQMILQKSDNVKPFYICDFAEFSISESDEHIIRVATEMQSKIDIMSGLVFLAAYVEHHDTSQVILVANHLIIDFYSWAIILEDLQYIYRSLHNHNAYNSMYERVSFQQWTRQMTEYADKGMFDSEIPYWLQVLSKGEHSLPTEFEWDKVDSDDICISTNLSSDETSLLDTVAREAGVNISAIVLAGMAVAYSRNLRSSVLLIDRVLNGRLDPFENTNLSRTVGWLSTKAPMAIPLSECRNIFVAIDLILDELRHVPSYGIGYDILRYSTDEYIRQMFAKMPKSTILFNYFGYPSGDDVKTLFHYGPLPKGCMPVARPNRYVTKCNSYYLKGELHIDWIIKKTYTKIITMQDVSAECISAIRLFLTTRKPEFTP